MSGPPPRPRSRTAAPRPHRPPERALQPLSERELDELQAALDRVPAPLEALDVSMLDGYLCGVLLQPRHIAVARWMPHVTDVDGRALPPHFDSARLGALVLRRHAELDDAIQRRQWFDPLVFELSDGDVADDAHDDEHEEDGEDDGDPGAIDAVYPWVAGFATALELFPDLMALDANALTEPLALVYRHLAPDDLEDADDLLAEIESLEPPEDLAEAVEGLVRATLLLADISRPVVNGGAQGPTRRGGPAPATRRR
jgi:uncharacterized protein